MIVSYPDYFVRRSAKLLTAPASEPVTRDEAKAHLRIESAVTTDDSLIDGLITAARQWVESYIGKALITQTWQVAYDGGALDDLFLQDSAAYAYPQRAISLPIGPNASSVSVTTYDDSDSATVFSTSNYYVDQISDPPRLVLRNGASWPTPGRDGNGMIIQYTCGYGSAAAVPEAIKAAVKMLVAQMYEYRGEDEAATLAQPSFAVKALLQPYCPVRL